MSRPVLVLASYGDGVPPSVVAGTGSESGPASGWSSDCVNDSGSAATGEADSSTGDGVVPFSGSLKVMTFKRAVLDTRWEFRPLGRPSAVERRHHRAARPDPDTLIFWGCSSANGPRFLGVARSIPLDTGSLFILSMSLHAWTISIHRSRSTPLHDPRILLRIAHTHGVQYCVESGG